MKNFLIKLLGGYTKEDIEKNKPTDMIEHHLGIVENPKFSNDIAMMRAVGVKYVTSDEFPSVVLNLSKELGLNCLHSEGFRKEIVRLLNEQKAIQDNCSTKFVLKVRDKEIEAFAKANTQ